MAVSIKQIWQPQSGADPEFLNRGARTCAEHSDRAEGEYVEYLQVLVLSNCILTVTHIHTIDIFDPYMN